VGHTDDREGFGRTDRIEQKKWSNIAHCADCFQRREKKKTSRKSRARGNTRRSRIRGEKKARRSQNYTSTTGKHYDGQGKKKIKHPVSAKI